MPPKKAAGGSKGGAAKGQKDDAGGKEKTAKGNTIKVGTVWNIDNLLTLSYWSQRFGTFSARNNQKR